MVEASRTQIMKNKIRVPGSVLLMFLLSSLTANCSKEAGKDKHSPMELEHDSIRPTLARQIEAGASEEYGSFDQYTKKDLDVLIEVEKAKMDQNGFKQITNEDFVKRIENIFGKKIEISSSQEYLKLNLKNKCDQVSDYKIFSPEHQNIYISKKDKILTSFYPLPAFLDYNALFPELRKLEKTPIEFTRDGDKMYAQRWKDIADLEILRNKNIQTTIHRNKYLFNDNRSSLNWLAVKDQDFLKRLVAEFGYDQEEKINTLALRLFFEEYSAEDDMSLGKLGRIVFVKGCDGKLQIRKGLLNSIEKSTTEDDDRYITALGDYIIAYLYKEDDNTFTPNEKAEIVAYISNIEGPAFHKYKNESDSAWEQAATPLYFLLSKDAMNHPEVLDIIKKNNYFDLQPLKEYIESGQLEKEAPPAQEK